MKCSLKAVALVMTMHPLSVLTAQDLDADEVKNLIDDKTWAIQWGGGADESRLEHWDFRSGGMVCARLPGFKKGDKCSDEGTWSLEGKKLCWELTWLGKADGYKSACMLIEKQGEGRYSAVNQKSGNLAFTFYPVD